MRYLVAAGLALAACGDNAKPGQVVDARAGNDTPAPGALEIVPMVADFGTVPIGTHSAPTRFTISNPGGSTVSLAVFASTEFSIDATTCTDTLAVGASCTADVAAAPVTLGTKMGVLTASAGIVTMATAQLVAAATSNENGALTIAPTSKSFGSLAVGQTSTATTFTVTNPGATTVGPLVLGANGADPSQFTIATNTCTTLAAAATCTFSVAFSPTSPGAKSASFDLTGPGAHPTSATATGTGLATPASISPATQDFGSATAGSVGPTVPFTITNYTAASVMLSATLGGADAASFVIAQDACTGAGLASQASCVVGVQFKPAGGQGSKSAQLDVGSVSAALSGVEETDGGVLLFISPSTLDFGNVHVGLTSASQTFTVTNGGGMASGALATSIIGANNAEFMIVQDGCAGVSLPALTGACTITARFSPFSFGAKTAQLQIVNGGNTVAAALSGAGIVAYLSVSPSVLDFGAISVGHSGVAPVTITNNGVPPTSPVSIALAGVDASQFTIGADGCSGTSLAGGQSCTVQLVFSPISSGAKQATLSVFATVAVNVPLTGAGASLSLTPSSHDFGSIGVTQTANQTFMLTNAGSASVTATASLAGSDAASFTITQDACSGMPLAPAAACAIVVQFHPMVVGSKSAALDIGTAGALASAPLTGLAVTDGGGFIAINPTLLDYATVVVGQTADASFTVTNNGSATTPPVSLAIAGMDPSQFALGADACSGVALANGQSCTVHVIFAPTSSGLKRATISAVANNTASVGLSGSGG